jgi:hypothetical protein
MKPMQETNQNQNQNQINIELPDDIAEGIYSNLAIITHSPSEFIVDFIKMMPGIPKAKVKSRIILTPQHAKRLYKALKDNIAKYESMHGEIKITEGEITFNLGMPPAQA